MDNIKKEQQAIESANTRLANKLNAAIEEHAERVYGDAASLLTFDQKFELFRKEMNKPRSLT